MIRKFHFSMIIIKCNIMSVGNDKEGKEREGKERKLVSQIEC